ncbi:MAG: hypothetical protein JW822_09790 [Spirochaetales bacterium]|nr:hypothetical protein [Spirochaetales bacterium]
MKKIIGLLLILLLSTGAFAQDISISAGAGINFVYWVTAQSDDSGGPEVNFEMGWSALTGGVFVDLTYVMVNLSYAFTLGGPGATISVDGTKDDAASDAQTTLMEDMSASYLIITVLAKYPFDMGGVVIFPMLGAEYQLNLSLYDDDTDLKDGYSDEQNASLNDLYILAGVGADFDITESLYARVMALFSYSLTPENPGNYDDDDIVKWGWNIRAGVCIGYRF